MLAPFAILSTNRIRFLAKAPPRCLLLLPTRLRLRLGALSLGMLTLVVRLDGLLHRLLRFFRLESFFKAF